MSTALLNRSEVSGEFATSYESRMASSGLTSMAKFTKSNASSQLMRWAGLVPSFREHQGQAYFENLPTYEINIQNKTWTNGVRVPLEDIEDDQTDTIMDRIGEFGQVAADLYVQRIDQLLIIGDEATGLGYDGKEFFAASGAPHVVGKSGSMINDLTSSEVAELAVTGSGTPTVEEMSKAIMGVIAYMMGYKDDQGRQINSGAKSFGVIVPPILYGTALSAVTALNLAGGATNVLSNFSIELFCNANLSWTVEFAVFIKDSRTKPFIVQERVPVRITQIDIDTAPSWVYENNAVGVFGRMRGNVAYGDFTKIARATLS